MLFIPILVIASVVMIKADTYTDRYDSMNVDDVIANRRLFIAYVKCVLNKGRCTPEGKELKCKCFLLFFSYCTIVVDVIEHKPIYLKV